MGKESGEEISWIFGASEKGALYRRWRFYTNINENLLLKISIYKDFREDVREIQDKYNIKPSLLIEEQRKLKLNADTVFFVRRYNNDLTKGEDRQVPRGVGINPDVDGFYLESAITSEFVTDIMNALLHDIPTVDKFERSVVTPELKDAITNLMHKYHLSNRYYRRIVSIILYNDFPTIPAFWKETNEDELPPIGMKPIKTKNNPSLQRSCTTLRYRTPVTSIDPDNGCIRIEIYPDTSMEVFKNKDYKKCLSDLQKKLPGFRKKGIYSEGLKDAIYYILDTYQKGDRTQEDLITILKKLYGREVIEGMYNEKSAKASTMKKRIENLVKYK